MDASRRRFFPVAAACLASVAQPRRAVAQAYPSRPVKIIVGYPTGGPIDIVARLVAQAMSERSGQTFLVENRPGAGGNVGAEAVVRAPADGHTLLLVGSNNFINATLYDNLRFNFLRDIEPVGSIGRTPLVMEVHPSVPATTVAEFVAYAKAHPGQLNMASGGIGTPVHMAGELFKMIAGVRMVHVPYRGSAPALTDLVGGQVQVMFDTVSSSIEHLRAKRLRALGVTTATPVAVLPGVPTISQTLPGFEVLSVQGLGAPKQTPPSVIERLNALLQSVLGEPPLQARFAELGIDPLRSDAGTFGKLAVDETDKWGNVVAFAGVKAE
jgi:tripartite-type tricarboxylate transporter receptor subunit TctC